MSNRILLVLLTVYVAGCGASQPARPVQRSSYGPAQPQVEQTPTIPVDSKPSMDAIRLKPTSLELSAARATYTNECSICHGPLATSAKRGVTARRLAAAGVPMAVPLHMELLRLEKWPFDVPDVKDDGIDTAILAASALVEVLK